MNLTWSVEESQFLGTPEVTASFSGYPAQFRAFFEEVLNQAIEDGYRVAMQEAPGAKNPLSKNQGRRIRDAIEIHSTIGKRGGLGGGATIEKSLIANGVIAPHLRFVWEGTGLAGGGTFQTIQKKRISVSQAVELRKAAAERGEEYRPPTKTVTYHGDEEIFAGSRFAGRMRHALFNIQKEGHTGMQGNVRPRISGQIPQREWWENAVRAVEARMAVAEEDFGKFLKAANEPGIAP
jgi:hypothetical protein